MYKVLLSFIAKRGTNISMLSYDSIFAIYSFSSNLVGGEGCKPGHRSSMKCVPEGGKVKGAKRSLIIIAS